MFSSNGTSVAILIVFFSLKVPEVIYQTLEEPINKDELEGRTDVPQTLEEFMADIRETKSDARTFALKLREMVLLSLSFNAFPLSPKNVCFS